MAGPLKKYPFFAASLTCLRIWFDIVSHGGRIHREGEGALVIPGFAIYGDEGKKNFDRVYMMPIPLCLANFSIPFF